MDENINSECSGVCPELFVPVLQRIVCSLNEFYFRQDGAAGPHTDRNNGLAILNTRFNGRRI